jgi:hypothetical protein
MERGETALSARSTRASSAGLASQALKRSFSAY